GSFAGRVCALPSPCPESRQGGVKPLMNDNTWTPRLDMLQHDSWRFFPAHTNPANGMVRDSSQPHTPCSIASMGFALSSSIIAVEHGWKTREAVCADTLVTLRFLASLEQSASPDASGYKGFFYHFLDMEPGRRGWNCELSTIDTVL